MCAVLAALFGCGAARTDSSDWPAAPNGVAFDPSPRPIDEAISNISLACPAMGEYLAEMEGLGRITFVSYLPNGWDGQTLWDTYSPDGLQYFRVADTESIELGDWLDSPNISTLEWMLRHEYGHAAMWADDGPNGTNGYETSCNGT